MKTRENLIFQQSSYIDKVIRTAEFREAIFQQVNQDSFGSLKFQLKDSFNKVGITRNEGFCPVIGGVRQKEMIDVCFLHAYVVSENKTPNVYDSQGVQLFTMDNIEAAVDCFLLRCQAEDPKQKVASDKESIWLL